MAHLRCDFFSEALHLSTSMTVILPQQTATQIGLAGTQRVGPPPVLYLLHGLSDDDTAWTRRTSIERYASSLGLAVVMPQVHRSFYTDQVYGGAYATFLHEELPGLVSNFFAVSTARADTFVAGLSMGGYGALTWALREPQRFAAAASLSGALDVRRLSRTRPEDPMLFTRIFGAGDPAGTAADPLRLLETVTDPPALYVCCGTEDELVAGSRAFVDRAAVAGVPVTSTFDPGIHDWAYWDRHIQDVLAWLPL